MIANEKRRRRRESHNAVERRRRDNINEKISELATLIPECMLDTGGTHPTLFWYIPMIENLSFLQFLNQHRPKLRHPRHPMMSYWEI